MKKYVVVRQNGANQNDLPIQSPPMTLQEARNTLKDWLLSDFERLELKGKNIVGVFGSSEVVFNAKTDNSARFGDYMYDIFNLSKV